VQTSREVEQNMGLLSILKKVKAKEKEVRLLILGLDNAGNIVSQIREI